MHNPIAPFNTLAEPAPRNGTSQNVARTMSSVEIAELTGKLHKNVLADIRSMLADLEIDSADFSAQYRDGTGRNLPCFHLDREMTDTLLTGYSAKMRLAVVRRWRELEAQVSKPRELSRMDLIQLAFEAEQARLQLTVQVQAQATKIERLENLFKEGMTHVQFCKGLNGVNVMQVGHFLETRNWLYNESRSGTRYRVAAYARDKYMTEHQVEVAPHGKEPFISFTPILLRKGAVRMYELYLAGELPMKKNWDGLFTHDKAVRGAA
ncbi:Phage regulatory protein Rha (Phage pRha) [Pseudomonas asplenii]|uniref:Phage regulatory protein Rha (Phage pRha) n=1 Tax=Pseudomonas asplenii TaxID=53407 RepID=A0A0N0VI85_9PSED|nr:Rha family transcriptional regulator [Pseudomonas fuscovaginae]KPA87047.1 Phage regulatory protein Rha (Phage pRha) [Pseudomonas fuscovaginae]